MYNADLQCRLQFNATDEDLKVCSQLDEICSQLWCSLNGTCTTLLRPAAPGTHCARHKVTIWKAFPRLFLHFFVNFRSGVKIKSVLTLKSFRLLLMVAGVTGLNGVHAQGRVELVSPCKQENVIIQHQYTGAHFASEKEQDTKLAILIHARTKNQVFAHNNAPRRTTKLLRDRSTHGYRFSTRMSPVNSIVLIKMTR